MNQYSTTQIPNPNADRGFQVPVNERSIDAETIQLAATIDSLSCRVDELAQRLTPIRRGAATQTSAAKTPGAAGRPLSGAIRMQREALEATYARVCAALDELEL